MHRAGFLIRQWREAHAPPLSAEEFGARYGDPWPSRTVYGWESKGKIARARVQMRLAQLGICSPQDWLEAVNAPPAQSLPRASMRKKAPAKNSAAHPFSALRTHGLYPAADSDESRVGHSGSNPCEY